MSPSDQEHSPAGVTARGPLSEVRLRQGSPPPISQAVIVMVRWTAAGLITSTLGDRMTAYRKRKAGEQKSATRTTTCRNGTSHGRPSSTTKEGRPACCRRPRAPRTPPVPRSANW